MDMDTEYVSGIVESLGAEGLSYDHLFEATLRTDGTFSINAEDRHGGVSLDGLTVDQVQRIHQLLGHLLYIESTTA